MLQPSSDTAVEPESNPEVLDSEQQVADDETVKIFVEHESGEILEASMKRSDTLSNLFSALFKSYRSIFGTSAAMSLRMSKSSTKRINLTTTIEEILQHPDFPDNGILVFDGEDENEFSVVLLFVSLFWSVAS